MATNDTRLLQLAHFSNMTRWSAHGSAFGNVTSKFPLVPLSAILRRIKEPISIEDGVLYKRITVRNNGRGVVQRDELYGREIGTKRQFIAHAGQLIISRIDARNGALGIVPKELEGAIVTNDFWLFEVHDALLEYLMLVLSSERFQLYWQSQSSGTTNRQRLSEDVFLDSKIVLPDIGLQNKLVEKYIRSCQEAVCSDEAAQNIITGINHYLFSELGIEEKKIARVDVTLGFITFAHIYQWSVDKNISSFPYEFKKFKAYSFNSRPSWLKNIFRGKSPKYKAHSANIILNQKCNRTDAIDLSFAKTVDAKWLARFDKDRLTRANDILINSTGEGTLGRASVITKTYEGLAYDSHMLLLRVNTEEVDPQLIVDLINCPFGQCQVELNKSAQATKQTELGIDNAKRFLFPLPDITEQIRISSEIGGRKRKASSLRKVSTEIRECAKREFESAIFR